jgi:integration host factor subunit alpha
MSNVTRDEISEFINESFGLTKKDCSEFVDDLIEEVISGLLTHKMVKIHNFGTFQIKQKKERIGRNPKTKKDVMIPQRNVIKFIPSKKIISFLNTYPDERKKL